MCWDYNLTIDNKGGARRNSVKVQVSFDPPQASFPSVSKWYEGRTGTARKVTPDGRVWEVEFEIDLPAGESTHVGWDFENDEGFEMSGGGYRFMAMLGGQPREQSLGAFALRLRGGVVTLANRPEGGEAFVLHGFQVAGAREALSLEQLIEGDEALEGLTWHDLLGGKPLELPPGKSAPKVDSREYDLDGYGAVLARISLGDIDGELRLESFHQVDIDRLTG